MPTEIILPRVDMDMTTGRIGRWLVKEGDAVEKGAVLFEIETDKAAMEIDAPVSGIVRNIRAADDEEVPVGTIVGWIYAPGEAPAEAPAAPSSEPAGAPAALDVRPDAEVRPPAELEREAPQPAPVSQSVAAADNASLGIRATPLARRLAAQHGIDLASVSGSGPKGRVQSEDVMALVGAQSLVSAEPAPRLARLAPASSASRHLATSWLREGEGTPAILIHGFGTDMSAWRPMLAGLATSCPVLAVDLPAHGQSIAIGADSLDDMAVALEETLLAQGIGSAHILGHSLGGAVSTALAARAAVDVRSLMLISPAGLGPQINGDFLAGFLRANSEASLKPWLRLLTSREADLAPGLAASIVRQRSATPLADAQAALAQALFPDGTQAFSTRDLLDDLPMPVKIVFGQDDRIIPAHHAAGLPGQIAIHLFAGIGHMPQLEKREAVGRMWLELMRSAA